MAETMYKYRCRPGYKSTDLVIEITINEVQAQSIRKDIFDVLKDINPRLTKEKDLWMNDEMLYHIKTDIGDLVLSVNVWNDVFILSEEQNCIKYIDKIFIEDNRFEKQEVHFNDYR